MLKLPAVQVLGTPTREDIHAMNPNYTEFKFPHIKAHPWSKVFSKRLPADAVDLVSAQPCCRISHGELTVAQSSLALLHIWGAAGCDSDKPHKTFRRQVVDVGQNSLPGLCCSPPDVAFHGLCLLRRGRCTTPAPQILWPCRCRGCSSTLLCGDTQRCRP